MGGWSAECDQGRSGDVLHVTHVTPEWTNEMPIFMSPRWLETQAPVSGWLESRPAPDMRIVVPYVLRHRAFVSWLQLQWGVWSSVPIDTETERAFLEGVVRWCRSNRISFVAQPVTMALFRTAPVGAPSAPFGTVLVDLNPSEDELWAGMKHSNRTTIRKARSEGVSIEWGAHLADEAYALCARTMARSELGFPSAERFRAMVARLDDAVDIGVARIGATAAAAVVNPRSRFGAHCLFAGTADTPAFGAANLLQWEAMLRARQQGARMYDFVGIRLDPAPGSKYAGLRQFKTRFGGEVVEGCLWKLPLSRWKYGLYEKMRHAQGGADDVIDQEGRSR